MKKNIWIIPALACGVSVLVGGIIVSQGVQNMQEARSTYESGKGYKEESIYDEEEGYDISYTSDGTVAWNGKQYRYNDHLSNYLFLGVDQKELADTQVGKLDAGQADAIFLLAWNRVEGEMTLISIPRDTMTAYDYYGGDGRMVGRTTEHLNLVYAYGDGKHESCRFTVEAVSNLFYGLPIEGYCAVSIEALQELMKEIKSVTVTLPNDSLEEKYPEYQEGTQITVDMENVDTFIRYRDTTISQSALLRLERQEAFLEAYMLQAEKQFAIDPGFLTRTYEGLGSYMVTNMGADQCARLMESLVEKGKPNHWTLPGEGKAGINYDEYYVDNDALYEKVIETFYIEET